MSDRKGGSVRHGRSRHEAPVTLPQGPLNRSRSSHYTQDTGDTDNYHPQALARSTYMHDISNTDRVYLSPPQADGTDSYTDSRRIGSWYHEHARNSSEQQTKASRYGVGHLRESHGRQLRAQILQELRNGR
jgi:hypothetical protein